MSTSEERIARLERRVRRQAQIIWTGALAGLAILIAAQVKDEKPGTLRVRGVTIVNATGEELAYFGQAQDRVFPELRMTVKTPDAPAEQPTINLDPAAGLQIRRPTGTIRLGGGAAGGPTVSVSGMENSGTVSLGISTARQGPQLWLSDAGDAKRIELALDSAGSPSIAIQRPPPAPLAAGEYVQLYEQLLASHDVEERDRLQRRLLNATEAQPALLLGVTELARGETGVIERRPEASIVFFDTSGSVMKKLP